MITFDHVSFQYAAAPILRDISFSLEQGEFLALTGQNGSGKSTLLKLLLGELPLQTGQVTLFDQPVKEFNQWTKLGYLPQNASAAVAGFPANALEIVTANLYSQIGRFRLPGRKAKKRAMEALALVGMKEYAYRLPDQLSGGQQQRVLLARAMVGQPELLILDEPTSGIDEAAVQSLYQLFSQLHKEGLTIFMVTHDVDRVGALASRTLCLGQGSLVCLSREQQLLEQKVRHTHPIPTAPPKGELL